MLHNSKLISETDENYHIQLPSGRTMNLNKKGLHPKAKEIISGLKKQSFADGGEVQATPEFDPNWPDNNFGAGMTDGSIPAQPTPPAATQQVPVDPSQEKLSNQNNAYEAEKQATQSMASATGGEGSAEAKAIGDTQKQIAALPTQQEIIQKYQAADQQYKAALDSGKIDPDHYWKNKDTGSKIAAGIGLLLGGIGSAFTGKNQAADIIQGSIDRDIETQKNDQSKTMNLWKMNREALGDDLQANLATQNQLYNGLKFKIEKAAAQFKGPMAQAQAQQAIAQIQQKQDENNFKRSLINSGDGDPAAKIPILVPPEQQAKALDIIRAAQNTKKNGPLIMEEFEKAANTSNPYERGKHLQALHTLLGPTFGDVEGTVRQAAMDNLYENALPTYKDVTKDAIDTKRKALAGYMNSKAAAPQLKAYGIDLGKYDSTSPVQPQEKIEEMKDPKSGRIVIVDANTKKPLRWK